MQIGELAAATGLSRDALRFYEQRGLLAALARKLADIDARIAGLLELRAGLARRLAEPLDACPLRNPAPAGDALSVPA